jgi:tetratricopeptide (TPR) repeat protein
VSSSPRRLLLLIALLACYLASGLRPMVAAFARRGAFDPFLPAARALEQRVAEGRFGEALALAIDLDRAYPDEPEIALQFARVYRGLGDAANEIGAWERYAQVSQAPAEACPALPQAYARVGRAADALTAYERCATFDPEAADRLIDLGDAYASAHRWDDALEQYQKASRIDPDDPEIAARIAACDASKGGGS